MEESDRKKKNLLFWVKKVGWIGVFFFTLKGLAWLAVFFGLGKMFGL